MRICCTHASTRATIIPICNRMAAPKLAPRSCSSSERRHDYDENCVSDSWDDEAKSEAGVRALPLPASGGGTSVSLLDANISNKANHWWYYGD